MRALVQRVSRAAVRVGRRAGRRDRAGTAGPGRDPRRRRRGGGGPARRQAAGAADLRRRRRADERAARRARGAVREPVHPLRRDREGQPAELRAAAPRRARRAALRAPLRAARRGAAGCSAPGWRSSWSTTARSRCCSRAEQVSATGACHSVRTRATRASVHGRARRRNARGLRPQLASRSSGSGRRRGPAPDPGDDPRRPARGRCPGGRGAGRTGSRDPGGVARLPRGRRLDTGGAAAKSGRAGLPDGASPTRRPDRRSRPSSAAGSTRSRRCCETRRSRT